MQLVGGGQRQSVHDRHGRCAVRGAAGVAVVWTGDGRAERADRRAAGLLRCADDVRSGCVPRTKVNDCLSLSR